MGAHKEFRSTKAVCMNCGKEYYPRYSDKGIFCSKECSKEYNVKIKYQDFLINPEKYYGKSNMKWIKKHILKEQNYKCAICGMTNEWNGKPISFILDHIDGHANNNNRDNLRLVCPNCDSQLDTYKSKNKNSDREYYHFNHR